MTVSSLPLCHALSSAGPTRRTKPPTLSSASPAAGTRGWAHKGSSPGRAPGSQERLRGLSPQATRGRSTVWSQAFLVGLHPHHLARDPSRRSGSQAVCPPAPASPCLAPTPEHMDASPDDRPRDAAVTGPLGLQPLADPGTTHTASNKAQHW